MAETILPQDINVAVTCATDGVSRLTVIGPHQNALPYTNFALLTRGIWFDISVGTNLPPFIKTRCCMTTAKKVVSHGELRSSNRPSSGQRHSRREDCGECQSEQSMIN